MGGGLFGSAKDTPDNDGSSYGSVSLTDTSNPDTVIPIGAETNSWAVIAPQSNSGTVYVGWDDSVDTANGFPLTPGSSISVDVDNIEQELWALPASAGDELRHLATK